MLENEIQKQQIIQQLVEASALRKNKGKKGKKGKKKKWADAPEFIIGTFVVPEFSNTTF